jgi:hypothetical protein
MALEMLSASLRSGAPTLMSVYLRKNLGSMSDYVAAR